MDVRITEGHDIRVLAEGAARPEVWVGDGAAALGLTGHVDPADFEALSELVTDEDGDQDLEDVKPSQAKTGESLSLLEQLRRDGVL
jgi:hypothetical protein